MTVADWICAVYCIACAAVSSLLLAWCGCYCTARRSAERRERRFGEQYMRIVAQMMLDGDGGPMSRFPQCDCRGARAVLADTLSAASAATCIDGTSAVRRMMAANGIEGWLLRRIRRSRGHRRAYYLAMLSTLPVSAATAGYVRRYSHDGNRHTRFRTLLVAIAAEPSEALHLLADYPSPLTQFEMAELTAMLRRGLLPLACAPLLKSPQRNLRMLGLNIAKIFGVVEAERMMLDILASDTREELRMQAVDVLVSLHLPVTSREVAAYAGSLPAPRRRALLRRLAAEGYSSEALERLAREDEWAYSEALVASYKCSLVCHI